MEFLARNTGAIYVDTLQGHLIQTQLPEIQKSADEGDLITIGKVTATLNGEEKEVNVYYKAESAKQYEKLAYENGAYTINMAPKGKLTVKIEIVLQDNVTIEYLYEITVYPGPDDPYVEDQKWLEF